MQRYAYIKRVNSSLNYVASDQCNSFYGSGLDKNNTWMKITNKDTKIGFYIQSVFI